MIVVKLMGGLGNQLFQYAFGYALSKAHNKNLKFDNSSFKADAQREYELTKLNLEVSLVSAEEISSIPSCKVYTEKNFSYNTETFLIDKYQYFKGYWQTEKYFWECRKEIAKQILSAQDLSSKSKKYARKINNTESISLHIRRGDYVTNKKTNSFHGTCSMDYYLKAIEIIKNQTTTQHFYIFSDDLLWAKENMNFIKTATFVELDNDASDHEEILLMSMCEHNIIANSSFSWWGAWLNQNDSKIVIAPKKWFLNTSLNTVDLIPTEWTTT